jgi:hypothetical protein
MAAGLGFKDFVTGEVLTAADVDGYLMQGVWVFASAAARDAAVTAPSEGNFAYLKDTNVTTYYTGSAWANLDTTGMTNPMTTTGDTIYSSSGSTPARLGIGTSGQVLTVSGAGIPSWATAAGGSSGLNLITSASFTTSSAVAIDNCFTSTYKNYRIIFTVTAGASAMQRMRLRASSSDNTTGNYYSQFAYFGPSNAYGVFTTSAGGYFYMYDGHVDGGHIIIDVLNPQIAQHTRISALSYQDNNYGVAGSGKFATTDQFDGIDFYPASGTLTGTYAIYGYGA